MSSRRHKRRLAPVVVELIMLRHAARLSQRELAQRVGIPQPSLSDIETGACWPNLTTLTKLAAYYGKQIGLGAQVDGNDEGLPVFREEVPDEG